MATKPLEQFPMWKIQELFTSKFGNEWVNLEDETIGLELGVVFSDLLLQKIRLLRVLIKDSRSHADKAEDTEHGWVGFEDARIVSDPLFLIHSSDIINNQAIEPTVISLPTSLEFAYTLYSLGKLGIGFHYTTMVKEMAEHVIKQDGFAAPVGPFSFVSEDRFSDAKGADQDALSKKSQAIKAYIQDMETLEIG